MKRLFGNRTSQNVDRRPAFLSMAALMILLLPTLMLITSTEKTTALPLAVAGNSNEIPPAPSGLISGIEVIVEDNGYRIEAKIRRSDVLASESDIEAKNWAVESDADLQRILRELKERDKSRTRIRLKPDALADTQKVVHLLDLLKRDKAGDLFPDTLIVSEALK